MRAGCFPTVSSECKMDMEFKKQINYVGRNCVFDVHRLEGLGSLFIRRTI